MRLIAAAALAAACLTSCAPPGARDPAGVAHIARNVALTLPRPPGFPGHHDLHQIVTARYGSREMAFESLSQLGPDRVHVTIVAPNGPRLASIDWSAAGIAGDRTGAVPASLRDENLLADMMLVFWPKAAIEKAIGPGAVVLDGADGGRTIQMGGRTIVAISRARNADGADSYTLSNVDFGYRLTMTTVDG